VQLSQKKKGSSPHKGNNAEKEVTDLGGNWLGLGDRLDTRGREERLVSRMTPCSSLCNGLVREWLNNYTKK
jgi:hypothetical protein